MSIWLEGQTPCVQELYVKRKLWCSFDTVLAHPLNSFNAFISSPSNETENNIHALFILRSCWSCLIPPTPPNRTHMRRLFMFFIWFPNLHYSMVSTSIQIDYQFDFLWKKNFLNDPHDNKNFLFHETLVLEFIAFIQKRRRFAQWITHKPMFFMLSTGNQFLLRSNWEINTNIVNKNFKMTSLSLLWFLHDLFCYIRLTQDLMKKKGINKNWILFSYTHHTQ